MEQTSYTFFEDDILAKLNDSLDEIDGPMRLRIVDENNKERKMMLITDEDDKHNTLYFSDRTNPMEVLKAIEIIEKKQIKVPNVLLGIENKDYENNFLDNLNKNYNLYLNYEGCIEECTYEEFTRMREAINYYKNVINENALSPMEKYFYAYDIVKSLEYKENEKDKSMARDIHSIISSGDIVCVGYSKLLSQLLKELDIKAMPVDVHVKEGDITYGHMRCLIKIDDDKYNYHGLFACDPTWDSRRENLSIIQEDNIHKIVTEKRDDSIKEYDGMLLYNHYLVPINEYEKLYENNSMPNIFKADVNANLDLIFKEETLEDRMKNFSFSLKENTSEIDENSLKEEVKFFFGDTNKEEIKRYIHEPALSLEQKNNLMRVVKKCQGYDDASINKLINNTNELNRVRNREYDLNDMFNTSSEANINNKKEKSSV